MNETINILILVALIALAAFRLQSHGRKPSRRHERCTTCGGPSAANLRGVPYDQDEWRLLLPEAAIREIDLAFGENSPGAYHLRRAIELSLEYLMEEIADDAECIRIIEERTKSTARWISLEELKERRRDTMPAHDDPPQAHSPEKRAE